MPSGSAYQSLIIPPPRKPPAAQGGTGGPPILIPHGPSTTYHPGAIGSHFAPTRAPSHGTYSSAGVPQGPVAGGSMAGMAAAPVSHAVSAAQKQADAIGRLEHVLQVTRLLSGFQPSNRSVNTSLQSFLSGGAKNPFDAPPVSGKFLEASLGTPPIAQVQSPDKATRQQQQQLSTAARYTPPKAPKGPNPIGIGKYNIAGFNPQKFAPPGSPPSKFIKALNVVLQQTPKPGASAPLPQKVQAMQAFADKLVGMNIPYSFGGGHSSFGPTLSGIDCSGFVSAVLHAGGYLKSTGPIDTTRFPAQIGNGFAKGPGKYVTVYDRTAPGMSGHVIIEINGKWYESGGGSYNMIAGNSSGVKRIQKPDQSYLSSFDLQLHPVGLGGPGKNTQAQASAQQAAAKFSGTIAPANGGKPVPAVQQQPQSPLAPLLAKAGPVQSGKVSWFGGPNDSMSGPTTASGAPVSKPGVALYNQSTLGGYYLVKMPNGKEAVLQQTDIGPAPWTGRKMDFTYSSLPALGYTENNFPTDGSITYRYLGKSVPSNLQGLVSGSSGGMSGGSAGGGSMPMPAGGGGGAVAPSGGASFAPSAPATGSGNTGAATAAPGAATGSGSLTPQQQMQQQLLSSFLSQSSPWDTGGKASVPGGIGLGSSLRVTSQLPDLALASLQQLAGGIKLTNPRKKKL